MNPTWFMVVVVGNAHLPIRKASGRESATETILPADEAGKREKCMEVLVLDQSYYTSRLVRERDGKPYLEKEQRPDLPTDRQV